MYEVISKTTGERIKAFATREEAERAAQSYEYCDILNDAWNGGYAVAERKAQ